MDNGYKLLILNLNNKTIIICKIRVHCTIMLDEMSVNKTKTNIMLSKITIDVLLSSYK